jgi:hypothetical protein
VCPVNGFMKVAKEPKFVTTTSVYVRQDTRTRIATTVK